MQSNTSKIVLAVIITAIIVGGGVYYWQQSKSAEVSSGKYENSKYGFTLNFPKNWGEIKEEVKNASLGSKINYQNFLLTSIMDPQRYIKIQVLKNEDADAPFVVDNPQVLITSDSIYSYYYSGAGDSAGKPGLEDQKYFDIQKEVKAISKTFKLTSSTVATQPDLEKSIVDEKNELFQTYNKISKELSSGYPVIFSNTSDPAVRFTILTHSGGDAMNTTYYFINQDKQKILQIDTEVLGGDFGDSGKLELSLNGGSAIVISREQVVNSEKREIEYQGLRVNKKLVLTFNNLIFKPTKALEFTVLGVSSDLTLTYFSDDLKQYSYNIVSNYLQEINELPSFMAKPIK